LRVDIKSQEHPAMACTHPKADVSIFSRAAGTHTLPGEKSEDRLRLRKDAAIYFLKANA
jgi:hypothetical protein